MKSNYHTHTVRCGHAQGSDEELVQAAIKRGFEEFGFSDHIPWPYRSGYTNPTVRMTIDRMDGYLASIRELAARYGEVIRLKTGFECEYFPEYMTWLREMKEEKKIDYLILGNHYDGSDETGVYFGRIKTAAYLNRYVTSTALGVESGLFSYLAHPDLFMRGYPKFDEDCKRAARELCAACRRADIPMEYNLHEYYLEPMTGRKSYPHPSFFEIAAEEGVKVILGLDAHEPQEILDTAQWERGVRETQALGLTRIERLTMR